MNKQQMPVLHAVHPADFEGYNQDQLQQRFVLEDLYQQGALRFVYTHYDRLVAGMAVPEAQALLLPNYDNLKSEGFFDRREAGIINLGGNAIVTVDGTNYSLSKLDCLYIGRGAGEVTLASTEAASPAVLFVLSAPAHAALPTVLLSSQNATPVQLGTAEQQNQRVIYKYIHDEGLQSCQLVMGLTLLQPGSIWNTMPPHLHDRRSEVYCYFDVAKGQTVTHYMGYPGQYRELQLQNYSAVASPPWSIHAGKGASHYGFIWGMAGENKAFTDMDPVVFEQPRGQKENSKTV